MMNISNDYTFGTEWEVGSMTIQLINIKGTVLLSSARWHTSSLDTMTTDNVEDPERFGMTVPPQTYGQFCAVANEYRSQLIGAAKHARRNTVVHCQDGTTRGLR